jgi:hypothetical protein
VADIVAICLEFTNVGFSAVISRFSTSAFRSGTAFRIDALNVGSQPNAGARFDAVLASKLPVDPRLPPTALEQADRNRQQPVSAYRSRSPFPNAAVHFYVD